MAGRKQDRPSFKRVKRYAWHSDHVEQAFEAGIDAGAERLGDLAPDDP